MTLIRRIWPARSPKYTVEVDLRAESSLARKMRSLPKITPTSARAHLAGTPTAPGYRTGGVTDVDALLQVSHPAADLIAPFRRASRWFWLAPSGWSVLLPQELPLRGQLIVRRPRCGRGVAGGRRRGLGLRPSEEEAEPGDCGKTRRPLPSLFVFFLLQSEDVARVISIGLQWEEGLGDPFEFSRAGLRCGWHKLSIDTCRIMDWTGLPVDDLCFCLEIGALHRYGFWIFIMFVLWGSSFMLVY